MLIAALIGLLWLDEYVDRLAAPEWLEKLTGAPTWPAGLAILPSLVYRPWSLEGDRIEIRDVSGDLPTVQVGLAWRRGAPLSPPALNFVRSAQSGLAER